MSRIFRTTLLLAVLFTIDKGTGLLRQFIIARQFGLTYEIDVFNAANNLPDLLSSLISGGALGVALIPVLSEYLQRQGRPEAWKLFARILNLAFLATGLLAGVIAVFAGPLVRNVIVPGFPAEQQNLTIELMRLDLLAIMIFSISGLVMAGLQTNQHFLLPALAPLLYDAGQIFGALILAPEAPNSLGALSLPGYGLGIRGLVYGVILGALLHLLVQVPGLVRYRFRWQPVLGVNDPGVRKVLVLLGPRLLTMLFIQISFIARDNIASHLGEGAVSALSYGWFIMQVPETLIGTALAIVLLPTLSEFIANGQHEQFQRTMNQAVRVLLALTVPAGVLLIVGLPPMVGILGFDAQGSAWVVQASRAYLLGLVGHALLEITARSFYAQQNARIPLLAAGLNAGLFLLSATLFTNWFGFLGLPLADSLCFSLQAVFLLFLLNRRYPGVLALEDTPRRTVLASAAGGLVVLAGLAWLPLPTEPGGLQAVSGAAVLIAGGLLVLPFIWKQELRLLIKL